MKHIIIKLGAVFALCLLITALSFAQGIRKDYLEMTDAERDALITAYWMLGDDVNMNGPAVGGLIEEIGDFHSDHFMQTSNPNNPNNCNCPDPIHYNDANLDVFLAWHRQASVELQRAMKTALTNEWITIPYWDWTISGNKSDPLWGTDWIGPFDSAWGLNRNPNGSGSFPDQDDINIALSETDFFEFSRNAVESNPIHSKGHTWTGGIMTSGSSPHDPAFFLHHNMVDKIWADWYELHGVAGGNYYVKTDMPRFDGTHTNALGQALPSVDPDNVADPRSLGIFYAANGLATLDKYTVTNASTPNESFGYQYTIEAKDNFIIPSGNNARIRSCNLIVLKPGFHAQDGSTFLARVDTDCDFTTPAKTAPPQFEMTSAENKPLTGNVYASIVDSGNSTEPSTVHFNNELSANPSLFHFSTTLSFNLEQDTEASLVIYDLNGRQISQLATGQFNKGLHEFVWNANDQPTGIYLARLVYGNTIQTARIMLAK